MAKETKTRIGAQFVQHLHRTKVLCDDTSLFSFDFNCDLVVGVVEELRIMSEVNEKLTVGKRRKQTASLKDQTNVPYPSPP